MTVVYAVKKATPEGLRTIAAFGNRLAAEKYRDGFKQKRVREKLSITTENV